MSKLTSKAMWKAKRAFIFGLIETERLHVNVKRKNMPTEFLENHYGYNHLFPYLYL